MRMVVKRCIRKAFHIQAIIVWVEIYKKVDTFKLCTEAMKHPISIKPARIYCVNCNHSNCIRISLTDQKNVVVLAYISLTAHLKIIKWIQ